MYKSVTIIVICVVTAYLVQPFYLNFQDFRAVVKKFDIRMVELFQPNSGHGALPADTQTTLYIIDSLHLKDYTLFGRLGDAHSNDPVNLHRINEAAWPVREDSASHNVLGYVEDMDTAKAFRRVQQVNNIVLGTY